VRLGGLGISRRFEVVQRQLATLPNGLREMQQVGILYWCPFILKHAPVEHAAAVGSWWATCHHAHGQ
jgi:hypothetical protein